MRRASQITLFIGGLLVGSAWFAGSLDLLREHRAVIWILGEIVAVLLVILAWRYRRDRLAVAAIITIGFDLLVRSDLVDNPPQMGMLAVVLAIDFLLVAVTRDRPLFRVSTLMWVAILGCQLWLATLGVNLIDERMTSVLGHPITVPAAMTGAVVVVIGLFFIRRGAFEASLIWVAASCGLAITVRPDAPAATLLVTAAALALMVGVFEDSYRLAYHDELTGLPGRRALDETLRNLGGVFTIAMADVDRFKLFNDRHGHDAGDQVLRMVADEMAGVGGGGRAFRYGGEEFAIVFPGSTVPDNRKHLESLRQSIAERKFALRAPDRPKSRPEKPKNRGKPARTVTVTISIGLAATNSRRPSAGAVIRAADRALYRAKKAGRNRVVAAGDRLKR